MCDGVTLLYSRNWHNIINQLYFKKQKKVKARVTEMETGMRDENKFHITFNSGPLLDHSAYNVP